MKSRTWIIALLGLVFIAGAARAQTLSSCGAIAASGSYVLSAGGNFTSAGDCFTINGRTNVTIDGNGQTITAAGRAVFITGHSTDITVRNATVGGGGPGVVIDGNLNRLCSASSAERVVIENIHFLSGGVRVGPGGGSASSACDVTIRNNVMDVGGIDLANYYVLRGATVTGNVVADGMSFHGFGHSLVENNTFYNDVTFSAFSGSMSYITIRNNLIRGSATSGVPDTYDLLHVSGLNYSVFDGNRIESQNPNSHLLVKVYTTNFSTFSNNTVIIPNQGGPGDQIFAAIRIRSSTSDNYFLKNTFRSLNGYGIGFQSDPANLYCDAAGNFPDPSQISCVNQGGTASPTLYCGVPSDPNYQAPYNNPCYNRRNRFEGNTLHGTSVGVQFGPGDVVTRNLVIGNVGSETCAEILPVTYINNTFHGTGGAALTYGGAGCSTTARNNIFISNGGTSVSGTGSFSGDYNLFWPSFASGQANSLSANPLLTASEQLQAGSPAIDRGDPSSPVPAGGGARVDIGAFEYQGGAPADTTIPTVSITSPANGATVSGAVTIAGTAADNVGLSLVEVLVDSNAFVAASGTTNWTRSLGVLANGSHSVSARATDSSGNRSALFSIGFNIGNAVDTSSPTAPTGLVGAPASIGQINLSWSGSTDNVGVTGYRVLRGGVQIATTSAVSYSDRGLASNTTFTYNVSAFDAAGNVSALSSAVSVMTPRVQYSLTVTKTGLGQGTVTGNGIDCGTLCSVIVTSGSVVTLTAAASSGSGFTGWSGACTGIGACTFTFSAAASVTAGFSDTAAPSVPTGLSGVAVSTGQIDLSWSASTDNVGVAGYRIFRSGGLIGSTAGLTFSDRGVTSGSTYAYTVSAYDAAGNVSAVSAPVSVVTPLAAFTLTVAKTGTGGGTVAGNGISCGTACSVAVASGTAVVLTATPGAGSSFAGWSGVCAGAGTCSFIMGDNASVTAAFADNAAPTVAVTSPLNGATVSKTQNVAVSASDNVAVTRVELYVGATLLGTDTAAPYTFAWDTTRTANGSVTLTAKAYDAAGNVGTSAVGVTVTVKNPRTKIRLVTSAASASSSLGIAAAGGSSGGASSSPQMIFNIKVDVDYEPSFPQDPSIQASIVMPSGLKTVALTRLSGTPGRYYALLPSTDFSSQDLAGLGGGAFSLAVGGQSFDAVGEANTLDPALGGAIMDASGAQVIVPAGGVSADAQINILPTTPDAARDAALKTAGMVLVGEAREVQFISSGTVGQATMVLPFDRSRLPAGLGLKNLGIAYYNPVTRVWEPQTGAAVSGSALYVAVRHFSLYAPVAFVASAAPAFSTALVYPNPAVAPVDPTIRVCPGIVDSLNVTIFNAAGQTVESSSQFTDIGSPVKGEGQGQYCYEFRWTARKAAGTYYAVVHAKGGGASGKTRIKFAVVK